MQTVFKRLRYFLELQHIFVKSSALPKVVHINGYMVEGYRRGRAGGFGLGTHGMASKAKQAEGKDF